ncbi:MAG: hypothetical protein MUF49_31140 [Oculatellaceae cyanobacterium Prado106]|jgi:hypothetical protein|nr:hypothetical protein [Oculatellaceae cyanobacterium Prado106]
MYSTEAILEAVLLIRPRLTDLLEDETAQQINAQILQLLRQIQAEQPVENSLLELLAQYEPTRTEMRAILDRQNTEDERSTSISGENTSILDLELTKGITYSSLPGQSSPQPKPKFKCPTCDYTWSRLKLGKPTPLCPQHRLPLDPVSS